MAIKYINIFQSKALKFFSKLEFWFEKNIWHPWSSCSRTEQSIFKKNGKKQEWIYRLIRKWLGRYQNSTNLKNDPNFFPEILVRTFFSLSFHRFQSKEQTLDGNFTYVNKVLHLALLHTFCINEKMPLLPVQ
jgi:hypothetical protein